MPGVFKSVSEFFRPTQQVVAAPAAASAPAPAAATESDSAKALESLKTLWSNDPNIKAPADPFATPLVNVDVAKLREGTGKLDLTTGISQDLMQKAMSGTDPAAFLQVLNQVGQNTVFTSAQLSASTVEAATARNNERLKVGIPNQIKQAQIASQELDNPILQHPAAAPFVNMTRQQIAMKNPGMSATEINSRTEAALVDFAAAVSEAPQEAVQRKQAANGTDWDAWAGIGT